VERKGKKCYPFTEELDSVQINFLTGPLRRPAEFEKCYKGISKSFGGWRAEGQSLQSLGKRAQGKKREHIPRREDFEKESVAY